MLSRQNLRARVSVRARSLLPIQLSITLNAEAVRREDAENCNLFYKDIVDPLRDSPAPRLCVKIMIRLLVIRHKLFWAYLGICGYFGDRQFL